MASRDTSRAAWATIWLRLTASPRSIIPTMRVVKTGRTIRELVLERGLLDAKQLDEILSVDAMTRGGIVGAETGRAGQAGQVGQAGPAGQAGRTRK